MIRKDDVYWKIIGLFKKDGLYYKVGVGIEGQDIVNCMIGVRMVRKDGVYCTVWVMMVKKDDVYFMVGISTDPKICILTHQFWTIFGHIWKFLDTSRHIRIILFNEMDKFRHFSDHFWTTSRHLSDNPLFEVLISSVTIANGQNPSEFQSHLRVFTILS